MNKTQKGFALIESLLIVLILVIIGFGGYYVWNSQKQTDKSLSNAEKASQTTTNSTASNSSGIMPSTSSTPVSLTLTPAGGEKMNLRAPNGWSEVTDFPNKVQRTVKGQLFVLMAQTDDQDMLKLDSYQVNKDNVIAKTTSANGTTIYIVKEGEDSNLAKGGFDLSTCPPDSSGFGCSPQQNGKYLLMQVMGNVRGQSPAAVPYSGSAFNQYISELLLVIQSMPV
jgi:type II secretory pathway pseudopilin PulG